MWHSVVIFEIAFEQWLNSLVSASPKVTIENISKLNLLGVD